MSWLEGFFGAARGGVRQKARAWFAPGAWPDAATLPGCDAQSRGAIAVVRATAGDTEYRCRWDGAAHAWDGITLAANAQTLTNKTLTAPAVNGGTVSGATIVVDDGLLTIQDGLDTTKKLKFEAGGIATATTRTLTAPDASGTIALVGHAHALTVTTRTATASVAAGANGTATASCAAGEAVSGCGCATDSLNTTTVRRLDQSGASCRCTVNNSGASALTLTTQALCLGTTTST